MELSGKLLQVSEEASGQSKTKKGSWIKRDFILETEGQYPKKVCISVFGTEQSLRIALAKPGDKITASVNIESREYNGKWYTQITAYKLETGSATVEAIMSSKPTVQDAVVMEEESDDLLF